MVNGSKIRGRIVELDLTIKDVAKQINMAQPTLSQKLRGNRPLSCDEAKELANILQIADDELAVYFFS